MATVSASSKRAKTNKTQYSLLIPIGYRRNVYPVSSSSVAKTSLDHPSSPTMAARDPEMSSRCHRASSLTASPWKPSFVRDRKLINLCPNDCQVPVHLHSLTRKGTIYPMKTSASLNNLPVIFSSKHPSTLLVCLSSLSSHLRRTVQQACQ